MLKETEGARNAQRRANRMTVLVHDGIGVWLAARRLNQGKFVWPKDAAYTLALTRAQLGALVMGLPWQRIGEVGVIGVIDSHDRCHAPQAAEIRGTLGGLQRRTPGAGKTHRAYLWSYRTTTYSPAKAAGTAA